MLSDVVCAHLERFPGNGTVGRPEQTLREILLGGTTAFDEIYTAFFKKEGIYGFGDLQVKNMLAKLQ